MHCRKRKLSEIDMSAAATNPLLAAWNSPFEAPPFEAIQPEHFPPAFEAALQEPQ